MFCKDCGKLLDGKGGNAKKYCTECAKKRKKAQDRATYIKRLQKEREKQANSPLSKRKLAESKLYKEHSDYLGIPISYYPIWKNEHPDLYKEFMNSKLGPFEE